ncbi:glycosyltransferase [Streptomyces chryseus]|uniref:glycosyltransferase n=1 Tax=Streptomyces chryseus TaxID=68186 RepID=UPI00110F8A63|nr:glycosyltransferase [Streptomyces chryseus]
MISGTRTTGPRRNLFLVGIDVDSMGGSQRVMHTLAQGFAQRGHHVDLIGIRPSAAPYEFFRVPAYRHTTLYRTPSAPVWHAQRLSERLSPARMRTARAARAERERARRKLTQQFATVDDGYVIIGSPWAVDWLASVEWSHLRGIGQYHESFLQAQGSAHLRLIRRHYPLLEKSVFLSEGDAAAFQRDRLPNATAMPNPLPFPFTAPAPLDTRRIGAVGRLEAVKRLDRLIDAFAVACAELPGWELHIFGDGSQELALREQAAQLGIGDRVIFRGSVSDMAAAYRDLAVLALTSEREGRPMALAEAAGCGVPCVSFDLSAGVRELIDDGRTGTLVRPGDTAALAEALRQLANDDELRRRYGLAAQSHVASLELPVVLDQWERLFDEIDR